MFFSYKSGNFVLSKVKMMTRKMVFRYIFMFCLMLLTMPGCAQSSSTVASIDTEPQPQMPARYHDEPPVVDALVRYQLPVDTRIALAGNYGELRPNHFHAGLDFKTDQTTGHPVYSFADGFVRRAAINAYGYGLVLYIEHPQMGLTSVYGHLEGFNSRIWQKVRERQVSEELNNADLTFGPEELPVTRGEVIAMSGNTGSSGGPHVHFELRNIPDDDNDICYDPQIFFLRELKDTKPPRISHIYVYPQPGQGMANGKSTRQMTQVTGVCATVGGQGGSLSSPLTAWGRIGLGLKAYDYMDGQSNKYGIKDIRLMLEIPAQDGGEKRYQLLYHFHQDAFRFSESRYTNSLTDYEAWIGQKSMIMKSYIEPGNLLQQVDHKVGDGIVDICEERLYHFIYELEDAHGNLTSLDFDIRGVRQPIAEWPNTEGVHGLWVEACQPTHIDSAGCRFDAAPGMFYTDGYFRFAVSDTAMVRRSYKRQTKNRNGKKVLVDDYRNEPLPCVSKVYTIGRSTSPIHDWCSLSIEVPADTEHPEQLYLVNVDTGARVRGNTFVPADASSPASMQGQIREGGRYAVCRDAKAPEVSVPKAGWQKMQVKVSDAGSGIRQFKVMIDGHFVPFDMDNTGQYFGQPCHYGIRQGIDHQVKIIAWDYCGNKTEHEATLRF